MIACHQYHVDREPVWLILHGVPAPAESWDALARQMSMARIFIPDLFDSVTPIEPGGGSFGSRARQVEALLAYHCIESVNILAADAGAGTAMALMRRGLIRCQSLLLVNPLLIERYWPVASVRLLQVPYVGALAAVLSPKLTLARSVRRACATDMPRGRLSDYLSWFSTYDRRRAFIAFLRGMKPAVVDRWFREFAASDPAFDVRVVWGDADVYQPIRHGEEILDRLNRSQVLQVLPGVGHFVHEDAPEKLREMMGEMQQ